MSALTPDSERRDDWRFLHSLWKRVAAARREARAPWTRLIAWGALAACLGAGVNAANGEGWRVRLATAWIASLWAAAPAFVALAIWSETRLAEGAGAFDELRLAEANPDRLRAILGLQAGLSFALPMLVGVIACALLIALGAFRQNGFVSLGLSLGKTVGIMPLALLLFCALGAFQRQGSRSRFFIGALGYWSAFALFMPSLAEYPLVYARLSLSP